MSLKFAVIINGVSRFFKIFIQLVVNAILARILFPEEFGVIAITMIFVTFFSMLSDIGFGSAVIQYKDLTEKEIDDIYSITIYLGFILAVIFSLLSMPIASFYNDNVYLRIIPIISISLFLNVVNMIPNAILLKNKYFLTISIRTIVVYLIGGVAAVIFALLGYSYYSLVIQTILVSLITYVWNYISTRPKFILLPSLNILRKIGEFSFFQFLFNVVNYFSRNLDNLLIGRFLGSSQLAYYDKSYTLMLYPVNNLTGVVTPVLHPILSDFQNEKEKIYNSYINIVKIFAILGSYVSAICYISSVEIISIIYGSRWLDSAPTFKILSIVIAFQMINSCSGVIFQSLGNTRGLFITTVINTIISISFILLGVLGWGTIEAVAFCVMIAYILHFIVAQFILIRYAFSLKVVDFYKKISSQLLLFVILFLAAELFKFNIGNMFLSLIIKFLYISLITAIYLGVTGEYRILKSLVSKRSK